VRNWLKDIRDKKGMTQKEFAIALHVEPSTYAGYEQGFRNPSVPAAKKIGEQLEIDWTLFFEEELRVEGKELVG